MAEQKSVTVKNGADDPKDVGKNNGASPATDFEASGAPAQVVSDVDPSHPAVDNDPRAATNADQNRIDFNDPTISGSEAVERNLKAQAGTAKTSEGEAQS